MAAPARSCCGSQIFFLASASLIPPAAFAAAAESCVAL
jgi:hypothetical protein